MNRGAFEEQKLREENRVETQRALLFILPLVMIAVLIIGIFFGYKFYLANHNSKDPISPGATEASIGYVNPMFYRSVSSASKLDSSFVPELKESCGVEVSADAADSLRELVEAGKDNGFDFIVAEGYISFEEQAERYDKAVQEYRKAEDVSLIMAEAHIKRTTQPAGECEQQTGLVVYLSVKTDGAFVDTPAYSWLVRNCVSYGFIQRYPDNESVGGVAFSSHLFRYVGVENALKMRALDMSFDAYINYLAAK